jgi:hypothetical protein
VSEPRRIKLVVEALVDGDDPRLCSSVRFDQKCPYLIRNQGADSEPVGYCEAFDNEALRGTRRAIERCPECHAAEHRSEHCPTCGRTKEHRGACTAGFHYYTPPEVPAEGLPLWQCSRCGALRPHDDKGCSAWRAVFGEGPVGGLPIVGYQHLCTPGGAWSDAEKPGVPEKVEPPEPLPLTLPNRTRALDGYSLWGEARLDDGCYYGEWVPPGNGHTSRGATMVTQIDWSSVKPSPPPEPEQATPPKCALCGHDKQDHSGAFAANPHCRKCAGCSGFCPSKEQATPPERGEGPNYDELARSLVGKLGPLHEAPLAAELKRAHESGRAPLLARIRELEAALGDALADFFEEGNEWADRAGALLGHPKRDTWGKQHARITELETEVERLRREAGK